MKRAGSITIRFTSDGSSPEVLIMADTEESQQALEPIARKIKKVLRPPLKVWLARLVLPWGAAILTRMRFTPRRSLLLDRLTLWAGK